MHDVYLVISAKLQALVLYLLAYIDITMYTSDKALVGMVYYNILCIIPMNILLYWQVDRKENILK